MLRLGRETPQGGTTHSVPPPFEWRVCAPQFPDLLLGHRTCHSTMVVFPTQTEPGSYPGSSHTGVIYCPQQPFLSGKMGLSLYNCPMQTTVRAWQEARAVYKKPFHFSLHMPLWGSPMLPHLLTLPDPSLRARKRITTLKHITMTFPELRALYAISRSWEFSILAVETRLWSPIPGSNNLAVGFRRASLNF